MSQKNAGSFIPTTNIWDVSQIANVDVTSPEFRELLVRLYQNINNIVLSLNIKDTGYYNNANEFVNGQIYFPDPALTSQSTTTPVFRSVFRTVVNFGALPNTATKSVAHNINPNSSFSFTRIYGCATKPTVPFSYIPIPYASPVLANNIELNADATNVNITTGSNRTAYTITYVILEYIKS